MSGRWFALMRAKEIRVETLAELPPDKRPERVLIPLWTTLAEDADGGDHAQGDGQYTFPVAHLSEWDLRLDRPTTEEQARSRWASRRASLRFLRGVPDQPGRLTIERCAVLPEVKRAETAEDARLAISAMLTDLGAARTANGFGWDAIVGGVQALSSESTLTLRSQTEQALADRDREWGAAWGDSHERPTPADLVAWVAGIRSTLSSSAELVESLEREVVELRKQPLHLAAIAMEIDLARDASLTAVLERIRDRRREAQERSQTLAALANTLGAATIGALDSVAQDRMTEIRKARETEAELRDVLEASPGIGIVEAARLVVADAKRLAQEVAELNEEMLRGADPERVGAAVVQLAAEAERATAAQDPPPPCPRCGSATSARAGGGRLCTSDACSWYEPTPELPPPQEPRSAQDLPAHAALMRQIRAGLDEMRRDQTVNLPAHEARNIVDMVHETLRRGVGDEQVEVERGLIARLYEQDVAAAVGARTLSPGEASAIKNAISDAAADECLLESEVHELHAAVDRVTGTSPAVKHASHAAAAPVLEEVGRHLAHARHVRHRLRQFVGLRVTDEVLERMIDAVNECTLLGVSTLAAERTAERDERIRAAIERRAGALDEAARDLLFGAIIDAIDGDDGDPFDDEDDKQSEPDPDTDSVSRIEERAAQIIAVMLAGRR